MLERVYFMNWASQFTASTTTRITAVMLETAANINVILPRYDMWRGFWLESVFHDAFEASEVLSASGMSSAGRS